VGLHADRAVGGRGGEDQIVALPGVWADIDIKGPAHKAINLPPTIDAAKEIYSAVQIRPTVLVHSGYGLQVYWLFRELWLLNTPEERARAKSLLVRWQGMLRRIATAKGWALDPTADLARMLRVPGTFNYKLADVGSRPQVRFRQDGDRVTICELADLVFDISDDELQRLHRDEKDSGEPAALSPILQNCPWMAHCQADAKSLPEPEWYHCLTVVSRCHDPEKHGHELSKDYPKYSVKETSEKLQQARENAPGPVTCQFVKLNFSGGRYCTECRHYGKIKSPIQLGRPHRPSSGESLLDRRRSLTDAVVFALEKAIAARDTASVYELAEQLAALDVPEWMAWKDKLSRGFGKEIRMRDLERTIKAYRALAQRPQPENPDIPSIVCSNRPLRDLGDDALNSLRRWNNPPVLFTRAGELVRIARDENERPMIQRVEEREARHYMTLSANYFKHTEDGLKHVSPPPDIVNEILARPADERGFPGLLAVVSSPTLRADGTVCDTPGYDAASGLYYAPIAGLTLIEVRPDPCSDDIYAAIEMLRDVACDFPFLNEAARATFLGLLLTPIVRPALSGSCTPLFIIDAPKAGTGKSLLVNVFARILTGRDASFTPYPRDDEEMGKQIGASLLAGRQLICFDNIEGTLASPALALALTASEYEARILGASQNMLVRNNAVWVATGNNVRPSGDIPRRTVHIRMDSRMSNPERGREFKHPDLLGWIGANRGALLHALLTIARAWWHAGCPQHVQKPLGSFELWHRVVGSILLNAGVEGFLADLDTFLTEADDNANQWETFLLTLADNYLHGAIFSVAALVTKLESEEGRVLRDALPDALAAAHGKPSEAFRITVGKAFSSHRDTRMGEYGAYLRRELPDGEKKVARWSIHSTRCDCGLCIGEGSGQAK
jgi:hypothetical protein